MKRVIRILFVLSLALVGSKLHSQDSGANAGSIAKSQFEEERYRKLRASLDDLQLAYTAQQERVNQLTKDIGNRLQDHANDQKKMVTRDEFQTLVDAVQELDRKREADRKFILEEIRNLGATLNAAIQKSATPPPAVSTPTREYSGSYQHEVLSGQNLFSILKAYNEEYKLGITKDDVVSYNPGLNPDLIYPGMVLNIPVPK